MSDLIDRQDLIKALETDCSWEIFDDWGNRTPTGQAIIETIKKLPSAEKAQLSGEDATFDCISRQDAIDAVREKLKRIPTSAIMAMEVIKQLPSASTELSNNSPKLDNENGDLISRKDAIDALNACCVKYDISPNYDDKRTDKEKFYDWWDMHKVLSMRTINDLPSAEPEIIRCINCKHRDSNDCPMYYEEWIEIDEGDGYFDTDTIIHDPTTDEGFCHCAELRGKDE